MVSIDYDYTLKEILDEKIIELNINEYNIINTLIFICQKDINGNQIHINFKKDYNNNIMLYSEIYEKYLFKYKTMLKVSLFGNVNNILEILILELLEKYTRSEKINYYLNVSLKSDFGTPQICFINNDYEFEFIKNNYNSTHNECPVCYTIYNEIQNQHLQNNTIDESHIDLGCGHFICRNCYSTLIINDNCKCPVCRTPFIFL